MKAFLKSYLTGDLESVGILSKGSVMELRKSLRIGLENLYIIILLSLMV